MVFKVLIYALRGLAILFLLLDIFQVGSFMWLAMVMVGFTGGHDSSLSSIFPFIFTRDKGFAFAATRRASLSIWV